MAGVIGAELQRGDILICKSYSLAPTGTHFVIRTGQFLGQVFGNNAPLGESNAVHAQIGLSTGCDPVQIAESDGTGLHLGTCSVESEVFRLREARLSRVPDAAAQVAEDLVNQRGGTAAGRYNTGRSAFSIVRFLYYGSSAEQLVKKVDDGTYANGFFCSMFVTVCYQVAALRCKIPVPTILNGDAMNMSPADLESYLKMHSHTWTFIGTLNLAAENTLNRWGKHLFTREHAH